MNELFRMDSMEYACILIITLNRFEHLKRMIQSLQKNTAAKYTDIYISVDYPPSSEYEEGWERICKYIDGDFSEFKSFNVYIQYSNLGVMENIAFLERIAKKNHKYYMLLEDDNELAPDSLEAMHKCIKYMEEHPLVFAACFMDPAAKDKYLKDIPSQYNAVLCPEHLGRGMVLNKGMEEKVDDSFLNALVNSKEKMRILKMKSYDCYILLVRGLIGKFDVLIKDGHLNAIDYAMDIYMLVNDQGMLYPKAGLIKNYGYDGSGVNCEVDEELINRNLTDDYDEWKFDEITLYPDILYKQNLLLGRAELIRTDICFFLYRHLGKKIAACFFDILELFKKVKR